MLPVPLQPNRKEQVLRQKIALPSARDRHKQFRRSHWDNIQQNNGRAHHPMNIRQVSTEVLHLSFSTIDEAFQSHAWVWVFYYPTPTYRGLHDHRQPGEQNEQRWAAHFSIHPKNLWHPPQTRSRDFPSSGSSVGYS